MVVLSSPDLDVAVQKPSAVLIPSTGGTGDTWAVPRPPNGLGFDVGYADERPPQTTDRPACRPDEPKILVRPQPGPDGDGVAADRARHPDAVHGQVFLEDELWSDNPS